MRTTSMSDEVFQERVLLELQLIRSDIRASEGLGRSLVAKFEHLRTGLGPSLAAKFEHLKTGFEQSFAAKFERPRSDLLWSLKTYTVSLTFSVIASAGSSVISTSNVVPRSSLPRC
jgi:hypothetical protein